MINTKNLTTKEVIIETTEHLLQEKGNVTIKEIAEAAFVNVAAINYHFGNKDNLMKIVIENVVSRLQNNIIKTLNNPRINELSFEDVMNKIIEVVFDFAQKNTGIFNYSFLQVASDSLTTNVLVNFFLTNEDYTAIVYKHLNNVFPEASEEELFTKHMILFSSFIVPLFLSFNLELNKSPDHKLVNLFNDFKTNYIGEIKRWLLP